MNSKERILATIAGETTDRVPCSYYAVNTVTSKLMEYLGVGSLRQMLDRLHADMFNIRGFIDPLWKGPVPKEREIAPGVTENYLGWRMKRVKTEYGLEEFHCDHVFADAETPDDLDRFQWPQVDWFDFSPMPELIRREYDGLALYAASASVFQHPTIARGLDNFLCDLLVNPELAQALIDKYTNFYLAYFDKMFSTCPGQIDVLRIADDVGTQNKPLVNLDLFRKYVKPSLIILVDMAHSHGVKVMFHSCGSVPGFIEDIIATGIDIMDPIQVRAAGMEPTEIKKNFGDRICLHGAIDIQWTMPKGTVDDVRAEAAERIATLGAGGRYILAPCHALQQDVPLQNIVALYDAVWRQQGA